MYSLIPLILLFHSYFVAVCTGRAGSVSIEPFSSCSVSSTGLEWTHTLPHALGLVPFGDTIVLVFLASAVRESQGVSLGPPCLLLGLLFSFGAWLWA